MKPPPGFATFLLIKLAPSTSESLVGDLQEEYESGRSVGWYWRQVIRAVTIATVRTVHAHPWLTIRATAAGWAFLWIFFGYVLPLLVSPDEWLFVRGIADIRRWWPDIPEPVIQGIIIPLACATAGSIAVRFHRRETVLIFAGTEMILVGTVLLWSFAHRVPAIGEGLTAPQFARAVLFLVVYPLSTVVGGTYAVRRRLAIRESKSG